MTSPAGWKTQHRYPALYLSRSLRHSNLQHMAQDRLWHLKGEIFIPSGTVKILLSQVITLWFCYQWTKHPPAGPNLPPTLLLSVWVRTWTKHHAGPPFLCWSRGLATFSFPQTPFIHSTADRAARQTCCYPEICKWHR